MNEWANNFLAFQFMRSICFPFNCFHLIHASAAVAPVAAAAAATAVAAVYPFWTFIYFWKTLLESKYLRRHHLVHSKWGLHCFRIDCFYREEEGWTRTNENKKGEREWRRKRQGDRPYEIQWKTYQGANERASEPIKKRTADTYTENVVVIESINKMMRIKINCTQCGWTNPYYCIINNLYFVLPCVHETRIHSTQYYSFWQYYKVIENWFCKKQN